MDFSVVKLKIDNITVIDDFFDEEDFAKIFELSKIKINNIGGGAGPYALHRELYPMFMSRIKERTTLKVITPYVRHMYNRRKPDRAVLHHDFQTQHVNPPYTFVLFIEADIIGEQQDLIFPFYDDELGLVSNEFTEVCNEWYAHDVYRTTDLEPEKIELEIIHRKTDFFRVSPKSNRAVFWKNDTNSWHCAGAIKNSGVRRNIIAGLTEST